jgi:hypothetical protein
MIMQDKKAAPPPDKELPSIEVELTDEALKNIAGGSGVPSYGGTSANGNNDHNVPPRVG